MTTSTATANRVADFIEFLIKNPDEREKLLDAGAAEIVQAGKEAGYDFTESDLNTLIYQTTVPTPQMAWSTNVKEACL